MSFTGELCVMEIVDVKDCEVPLKLCKEIGVKRSSDNGIELMVKKPRVLEFCDESLAETFNNLGDLEFGSEIKNDEKATCSGDISGLDNLEYLKKDSQIFSDFDLNVVDVEDFGFDLNVPTFEVEGCENDVVVENKVEVVDISSDESDEDEVIVVSEINSAVNSKLLENRNLSESIGPLSLGFGTFGGEYDVGGSSLVNGKRRYTRDEKGKVKVDDSWLSLTSNLVPLELGPRTQESSEPINVSSPALRIQELEPRDVDPVRTNMMDAATRIITMDASLRKHELRRIAVSFARFNSREHRSAETLNVDKHLGTGDSPFSVALKNVREQNVMRKKKLLIEWSPSGDGCRKSSRGVVPSLLELSLKVLAQNAAAIVSLEGIPYILRRRLADLICNFRSMNAKTFDLFVKGSPSEVCVKDCHWLTEDQFSMAFGNFDVKKLVVLQLELCGQCNFDYVMGKTFAGSLNSMPNLVIVSLKGASRLSDEAVEALVRSAPTLQSITLSQCSLLTEKCIDIIADAIGPTLKELYIDECQRIHAMSIKTALSKFEILEILSVAGIQAVCDKFVEGIVIVCGKTLKELNLADCPKLTDYSLEVIARTCSSLRSLNISKLHQLTDLSLEYLANGCRFIHTLTLHGNRFSDDALAAFLETSGKSLKKLSLNNVSKVGCNTAISLAKHSRGLLSLDLSWCRRVTNEALGLIVDCCSSLRLLRLFGCTQINGVFLNGHSNTRVQIVGLSNTPLLENMNGLQPEELLLRYSEL
ncbi:hypothetical protein LIER_01468 [Lithospermum erythrorhizon]|uniref:Rad7 n=1 Tax=Lithospermum erythrorhizon TaxID=34254 RepID=A0AAV3NLR8_LITER